VSLHHTIEASSRAPEPDQRLEHDRDHDGLHAEQEPLRGGERGRTLAPPPPARLGKAAPAAGLRYHPCGAMRSPGGLGYVLRDARTWAAAAACGGYVYAFARLLDPGPLPLALFAALVVGMFAAWCLLYPRTEEYLLATHGLDASGREEAQDDLAAIASDFREIGYHEGEERVRDLRQRYENLADILGRRLSAGELTHGRYLATAEVVYRGALENLRDVAIGLRNLKSIDPEAASMKLSDLRRRDRIRLPDTVATSDRRALYEEERRRIASLLAETELAMNAIDRTSTALARTRTGRAGEVELPEAMKELEALAARTASYASQRS
jgi:hypothetical protein